MNTVVCVNLVPYETGSPRDAMQHTAMVSIIEQQIGSIFVATRADAPAVEKTYPSLDISCLDRDAQKEIGGPRSLPFIVEMMDYAAQVTADDDGVYWIGVLNSDIIVTDKFVVATGTAQERADQGILIHRTDIAELGDEPLNSNVLTKGIDGFLVTQRVWENLAHTYPDFALGEPGWGQGTEHWMRFHGIKHSKLMNHEVLHVRHGAFWKKNRTAVGNHNQRLYQQIKLLDDNKGKL